jgi:hypothetical protein
MNLHTEQTHPYITIWTTGKSTEYYEVRAGKVKRDYLDNTHKGHGYNCQPMTTINQHGWEILLPQDVVFEWDGGTTSSSSHIKILEGQYLPNGQQLVDNSTGNGTITFNINAVIETHSDYYCLLSGSPNNFVYGAIAMNALVRTDWYHYNPLQFCWKATVANEPIIFKKGTPFVFLMPYPKNLINETQVYIKNINDELKERIGKYSQQRASFYNSNNSFEWTNMYRKGIESLDESNILNMHTDRPQLQKPIIREE